MWQHTGTARPDFAHQPAKDQESVWDYPRPPALDASGETVVVRFNSGRSLNEPAADPLGLIGIASTQNPLRILETAHPPTYYLPASDVEWSQLIAHRQTSFCEWKGIATYFSLAAKPELGIVAWRYADPNPRYAELDNHVSFYPSKVNCQVNNEQVRPQPGDFYGGWITDRVVGPFKGEPGTQHW